MASHTTIAREVLYEWSRRLIEETQIVALHEAQARTFNFQRAKRIEVVEVEDPELRHASAGALKQKTADRLRQYNIKIEGEDTGSAMRILIGMLLQEIDDLRAIVEASRD